MGLFSDFFGSSSHTQTTQSTSNVTNTQLAGGGIQGSAVYGSGNVIESTDAGSIAAATDISDHALALGLAESEGGNQVAIAGLSAVSQVAGQAVDKVTRFAGSALNTNAYIAGKSLDDLAASYSDSLTAIANTQNGTLATVEQLAGQVSQSNQQSTDTTLVKVAMFAAIGLVAFFLLKR